MKKAETFTTLNGLRFLAALAVVVFHYAPRVDVYGQVPDAVKNVINEGPCAVGFFFILSGFVLAHRHLYGEARAQTAVAFYWARFVRLYPAYLLALLLFLPIAAQRYIVSPSPVLAGRHTFIVSAVLSGLMLQSWTPLAQAWNGPSWSLSVEAFMYLLFPVLGLRLARLRTGKAIFVTLAAWLIPAGLAVAYVEHGIPEAAWRLYITNDPLLWLPLFVMGICSARFVSGWKRIPSNTANLLATISFVAVILAALAWPHKWADVFVTGGVAPLLVAVIVSSTRPPGWIAKTIGGPSLNRLGEASYAMYILQAPLWHYWQEITNSLRGAPVQTNPVAWWQFAAFVPLLILISLGVVRYIETPARGWLGAWRKRRVLQPSREATEPLVQPREIALLES